MNQAQITISSTQHDISDEPMWIAYAGKHRRLAGNHIITYEEYPTEEGNISAKNTNLLKIGQNFVHITKRGTVSSQMHFEPGKKHQSTYQTPYGSFDMAITTENVSVQESDKALLAKIEYFLSLNQCPVSKYTIEIEVKFTI